MKSTSGRVAAVPAAVRAAAALFPLLGRPRLACPSLPERINAITNLADTAEQQGGRAMAQAADALNRAALLASDCGLSELARVLCREHIDIYRTTGRPLTVQQARNMIEPALNLARLEIRAQAGDQALALLEVMYQAVSARTDAVIDGRTLPLAHLTGTPQEHRKLREWVWMQYLADGIRVLATGGRWEEAVAHAHQHQGIGLHLMEGRQAVIIAARLRGDLAAARAALRESTPIQPWEQQVSACLSVMCGDPDSGPAGRAITAMIGLFLGSEPRPGYAVFRARLGLTAATLAATGDAAERVLNQVVAEAINAGDGYAARDILSHRISSAELNRTQHAALSTLVVGSGLGAGPLPETTLKALINSAEVAKRVMVSALSRRGEARAV